MPLYESTEAERLVGQDLVGGFGDTFESTNGGQRAVGIFANNSIGSETVAVVAWEWDVRHVGWLQDTPATQREVTLRGLTVIEQSDGEELYSRHIDWFGLYAELGALTITRPQVDDREGLGHERYPADEIATEKTS